MSTTRRTIFAAGVAGAVALAIIMGAVPAGASPAASPASVVLAPKVATSAPKPVVTLTMARKAYAGDTITISTKGTKIPAGVKKMVLKFGDKTTPLTATTLRSSVKHKFATVGTFTVSLTITDKAGHLHAVTKKIVLVKKSAASSTGALKSTPGQAPTSPLPKTGSLPASVDLTAWAMPVGFQADIGSCVTWAVDYGLMGWYAKRAGWTVTKFAPMYTYAQLVKGNATQGTFPSDVLNIAKKGVDSAADYPGWNDDFTTQPTAAQRANATKYRIASWHEVINSNSSGAQKKAAIEAQLASGYPMVIGMDLYMSFPMYQGGVYTDTTTERDGEHEMLVLGYNASGVLIENSWGTGNNAGYQPFGTKTVAFGKSRPGYAWISWATVEKDVVEADVISGLVQPSQDTTPPTATAPVQRFVAGSSVGSNGVPVRISWSGSDNSGKVVSYDLWASTNGQPWTQQALSPANATSVTFALRPGSTYRFAVRARDAAGNVSAWEYGPSFGVGNFQETSSYVHYSGTGWKYVAWAPGEGGQVAVSSTAGDWVSFTFTGRNVAWVSAQGSSQGKAYVYLDGTYRFTMDLYSTTTLAQTLVVTGNFTSVGTHTLSIEVVGTSGRPNVSVDSFAILG